MWQTFSERAAACTNEGGVKVAGFLPKKLLDLVGCSEGAGDGQSIKNGVSRELTLHYPISGA